MLLRHDAAALYSVPRARPRKNTRVEPRIRASTIPRAAQLIRNSFARRRPYPQLLVDAKAKQVIKRRPSYSRRRACKESRKLGRFFLAFSPRLRLRSLPYARALYIYLYVFLSGERFDDLRRVSFNKLRE